MIQRAPAKIWEHSNGAAVSELMLPEIRSDSCALQTAVLHAALEFETILAAAAIRADIPFNAIKIDQSEIHATRKILIATGHQPVIYHPGLSEKESFACQLAQKALPNAIAINFILDLDEQECRSFEEPIIENGLPITVPYQLSAKTNAGLPVSQTVEAQLVNENKTPITKKILQTYRKLKGEPIAVANTVIRRSLKGCAILHVPFSLLIKNPAVQEILTAILRTERLSEIYNAALESFRSERKIKNLANPFPNLLNNELPFWVWSSASVSASVSASAVATRRVLKVGESLAANEYLVPRGALVSLFLRSFCCDIFIHGLGGKSYEPAVELLINNLNVSLLPGLNAARYLAAPYFCVSANQYPFNECINEYELLMQRADLVRSGPSHIPALLAAFPWDILTRDKIIFLALQKSALIAELQEVKVKGGAVSTKELGIKIKACDAELKSIIESNPAISAALERLKTLQLLESTLYRRNFPFWYS